MLDFLVVGSGLTGATIARELHDAGKRVLVVERRSHVGGNVHDFLRHGIRVHTYGPHYFRTNNDRLWEWVNRFADWHPYEAVLATKVDGTLHPWPITTRLAGVPALTDGNPRNFEDACLQRMSRETYKRFVEGYTRKQWGVDPITLDAELAARFPIREGTDRRLVTHKHQGIPVGGYAAWTAAILDGIPVVHEDWLKSARTAHHVVFTGPIDELYRFDLGRLTYRGQKREHVWQHAEMAQRFVQVNNPGRTPHVRTIEWRHMMPPAEQARCRGTIVTTETPYTPDDPDRYEYPFPDRANRALYERYRARADADPNLTVCGRLGEYRYYDMDQAIGRALVIARRLGAERAAA